MRSKIRKSTCFTGMLSPPPQLAAVLLATAAIFPAGGGNGIAQAQTVQELPAVVVDGGTIAVKSKTKPKSGSGGTTGAAATGDAGGPGTEGQDDAAVSDSENAGRLLQNQGGAVTVVSGEDLRRQQIRHAADALRSLPGVSVNRTGGNAGLTQVRIRGAEGNHTLVIIDGIEANQSGDGEFDFSNLATEDIERIEVLRGVQSGLYGSGAIGGVINIVTRSGKGPLTLRARAEGGSFNTRDGAFSVSAGNDKIHGIVSLHKRQTDGFNISASGDENDGNEITSFSSKIGVQVFDNFSLQGVMRHSKKSGDRDDENFSLPPGIPLPQTDTASVFASNVWLYGLEANLSLAGGKWLHSARADRNETRNEDFLAAFSSLEDYESARNRLRYSTSYELVSSPAIRHFVTGLVEHAEDSFLVFTSDAIDRRVETLSYAGEVRGEYWNSLFLTASVRHDDSDEYEDFTTWRTTGSLRIPDTPLRLHASAGTGIKYPSLFERFGRFPSAFTPNPDLIPEESTGWDAGAEVTLFGGRAIVDATYFESELENKITGLFAPVNLLGTSFREGVELTGAVTLWPGLSVSSSYTYLMAEEPMNVKEVRRPEHSGRVDVNYGFDHGRGNFTISALYNGAIEDEAVDSFFRSVRVDLDEYWLVRASAAYKVQPGIELFGRVENLLDEDYQEVFGFETAGAAAYAGVRLTYEEPQSRAWAEGR